MECEILICKNDSMAVDGFCEQVIRGKVRTLLPRLVGTADVTWDGLDTSFSDQA